MSSAHVINTEITAPLSELQKRLWHFEKLEPGSPADHISLCLQLEGPLNIDQFRRSLNQVLARHEALRARADMFEGLVVQRVNTECALALPIVDLSHRPGADGQAEARKRMQVWVREPFKLRKDTLVRARLVRLGADHHWLHVVAHRFVCDDESLMILVRELAAIYHSAISGCELPRAPSTVSYQELINLYADRETERAAYWRSQVRVIFASAERRRVNAREPDSALEFSAAKAPVTEQFKTFLRDRGFGMADLTLSAFAVLLRSHTGKKSVPLNVMSPASERVGTTQIIGPMADAFPLRLEVDGSAIAEEVVRQVKDTCAIALSNAPLLFDVLADFASDGRGTEFDLLTDTLFAFSHRPRADAEAGSVRFCVPDEQTRFSRFNLEWHVREENDWLWISAFYKKQAYEATTVEHLLKRYCSVLAAMALQLDQKVDVLLPPVTNDRIDQPQLADSEVAPGESELEQPHPERDRIERDLAEIWAELLRVDKVLIHDNFFALGGDSILSVLMATKARQRGLLVVPRQVFQHQTIASLAAVVAYETPPLAPPSRSSLTGSINVTPIQQWFFEWRQEYRSHFNLAALLEGRPGLDAASVVEAVRAVRSHHDSLRMRFVQESGEWKQVIGEGDSLSECICVDLSERSVEEREEVIKSVADELHSSIDIENGPVMRAAWFDCGPETSGQLLFIVHHLAVDGVSSRILIEDLEAACLAASHGKAASLPRVITSYRQWAVALDEHARSPAVQLEADYWLGVLEASGKIKLDFNKGRNTVSSARHISIEFDQETTLSLMRRQTEATEVWIQQALLASLARALGEWSARAEVRIELEGHGRRDISPEIDVTRTVGWFTALHPLRLRTSPGDWPGRTLAQIREQLRDVPQQGIGYGLLRYRSSDAGVRGRLTDAGDADVCFNYMGRFNHFWSEAALFRSLKGTGVWQSGDAQRAYVLQVDALIADGRLHIECEYSANLHRCESIQSLTDYFKRFLLELSEIDFDAAQDYDSRRFDLAALDQNQLARVIAALDSTDDE